MRGSDQFSTPNHPAKNIIELYQALHSDQQRRKYIYRGQVREYPGPLLPSMYRGFFTGDDMAIDTSHPLAKYSIKKCGRRFFGDFNVKITESISMLYTKLDLREMSQAKVVFEQAMNGKDVAALQIQARRQGQLLSWFDSLANCLSDKEQEIFNKYFSDWKPIINRYHRRTIRMFFFYLLFGYTFGTLLSQQYGMHSGCLDATTDLRVAIFFATHDHGEDYTTPKKEGVGIIYRFPYKTENLEKIKFGHAGYYTLPPMIDYVPVMKKYLNDWQELRDMTAHFVQHGLKVYLDSEKKAADWTFPAEALELTRFWRQSAVLLLPDELRRDDPKKMPGVAGINVPAFQFIEDLAAREGMEKFYFKHTGDLPRDFSLSREYLWPRKDPYLPILAGGMTAIYPLHRFLPHIIPYRLNLIDHGYGKEEFLHFMKSLALDNPIEFFGESDLEIPFFRWGEGVNLGEKALRMLSQLGAGGSSHAEDLRNAIKSIESDGAEEEAYEITQAINIGERYFSHQNYSEALKKFEEAIKIAEKLGQLRSKGTCLNNIGEVYRNSGNTQMALEKYEEALLIADKFRDLKLRGAVLNNIGEAYRTSGKLEIALEKYKEAIQICEKENDLEWKGISFNNVGMVYHQLEKYSEAMEWFEKALEIAERLDDSPKKTDRLNNIGMVYLTWGKYDEALNAFHRLVEIIDQEQGDQYKKATCLNNIGVTYFNREEYENAMNAFKEALNIIIQDGMIQSPLANKMIAYIEHIKRLI